MEDLSIVGILLIFLLPWILLSVIVGALGSERTIGFGSAFILSFFFSPIVGLLFVFNTRRNDVVAAEQYIFDVMEKMVRLLENRNQP